MTVETRVALLLLDGASPDVFQYLADAGELPNISRYILEPGGIVPAVTALPSTTGVAYLPLLTGCYPGTCNVPGTRWLDCARYAGRWWRDRREVRSYCGYQAGLINADLRTDIRTLFELIPDSLGLCTPVTRGLGAGRNRLGFSRGFWGSVAHYTARYRTLERIVGREVCRLASRHQLVFVVFPGIDGVTHFFDPWHPEVVDLYGDFDQVVGRYAAAGGFDGDQLTMIVSDHGLSRVERHTDLSLALEELGLPTLRHPLIWRRRPKTATMVSGNGSAQVYLRPGTVRARRHMIEEIEEGAVPSIPRYLVEHIVSLPGVAMVVATSESGLTLVSRRGRAELRRETNGEIRYQPNTADILGIGGPARLSDREWLTRTIDGPFPDAPAQLLQLFRSRRAGDLLVIADVGTDLRRDWEIPEHRSGHGSLVAQHMRCLVAANRTLSGPLRTVDLFPLALEHLGLAVPTHIDGITPAVPEHLRQ